MERRNNEERIEDILTWQRNHDEADDKRFTSIDEALAKLPCHEDIREIVNNSIQENFTSKGLMAKNWIIGAAVVITSITAIVFGLKTMLAWIGINITKGL